MKSRGRGLRRRRLDPSDLIFVWIGVLILLVLLGVGGLAVSQYMNERTETCTVVEKDRTRTENGSDMRVYTEECGVLQVQDLLFAGEFDSADTFSALKEGQTYEITLSGYRVPILSMFPVVRDVK